MTDACMKDLLCVDACPTDCIHPKKDEPAFETATQLCVDPNGCKKCRTGTEEIVSKRLENTIP